LNGAEDGAGRVPSAQNYPLAAHHARRDAQPERIRFFARQRLHETDGSAAFDAIDEHIAQGLHLALADNFKRTNLNGMWHRKVLPQAPECCQSAGSFICGSENLPVG